MPTTRRSFVQGALFAAALPSFPLFAADATAAGSKFWAYVGTTTGGNRKSKGIYLLHVDPASGVIENKGLAAETASPTFLAVDRDFRRLFASNEISNYQGKSSGSVSSFRIDRKTGALTAVNVQPSGGATPAHLAVDVPGKNVLVANYNGGSVQAIPVDADGTLREPSSFIQHTGRGAGRGQTAPRAHGAYPEPTGKYILCPDLALDKIFIYPFDSATGKLNPDNAPFGKTPATAGPRQLRFSNDNRFVYCINELGNSITVFTWEVEKPALTEIQTISTLPADYRGTNTAAQLVIHPSGKFLYGSNRTHDSIAIFDVDPATGKLTAKGHVPSLGKLPRNIALDPTGQWLLAGHQNSDFVVPFKVDQTTGSLTAAEPQIEVSGGIAILFVPVG